MGTFAGDKPRQRHPAIAEFGNDGKQENVSAPYAPQRSHTIMPSLA
jgi:hypothetical protein